jgi:hypothetical protein
MVTMTASDKRTRNDEGNLAMQHPFTQLDVPISAGLGLPDHHEARNITRTKWQ